MFVLANRVLLPPEKEEALSLNLYTQQVLGTLDFISFSNFFPSF